MDVSVQWRLFWPRFGAEPAYLQSYSANGKTALPPGYVTLDRQVIEDTRVRFVAGATKGRIEGRRRAALEGLRKGLQVADFGVS
jgi:hypothetical protein